MSEWKQNFSEKLKQVQAHWIQQFDNALDNDVMPAYDDVAAFVRNHDIATSIPMREEGRRSFKFELAENAYLLMIFRSTGIGEFEVRCESFAPGQEPKFAKQKERIADVNEAWAQRRFREALDTFVDHLAGNEVPVEEEVVIA
jgi:hypothetical protein